MFISFFFALKDKLQVLKFGFCQIKLRYRITNLQLTDKISLKLDPNSSLLLGYGHQYIFMCPSATHIFKIDHKRKVQALLCLNNIKNLNKSSLSFVKYIHQSM